MERSEERFRQRKGGNKREDEEGGSEGEREETPQKQ